LAWTEAVTLVTVGHVPDEVYEQARAQFNDKELADLTLAIVAINGANRLNIAFRTVPGSHRVAPRRAAE
jgi:alkylhydroperoxidase family enzyme